MSFRKTKNIIFNDAKLIPGQVVEGVKVPELSILDSSELQEKLICDFFIQIVEDKPKSWCLVDYLFLLNEEPLLISKGKYFDEDELALFTQLDEVHDIKIDLSKQFLNFRFEDLNHIRSAVTLLSAEEYPVFMDKVKGEISLLIDKMKALKEPVVEPVIAKPEIVVESRFDDDEESEEDVDITKLPLRLGFDFSEYSFKVGAGDFLNSTPTYGMDDYVSSLKRKMDEKDWKSLKAFLQLPEEFCSMLYRWQQQAKLLEVMSGDFKEFSAAYIKLIEQPKSGKVGAKSLKKSNKVDHLSSRLPQAANSKETFFAFNSNPRRGELSVYVNLFDIRNNFYTIGEAKNMVQYPTSLEDSSTKFLDYLGRSNHSARVGLFPHTPHNMGTYTDDQFDMLADVRLSTKKENPSLVGLMFSTQGGQMSEEESQIDYVKVGALATVIGAGVPTVYKLRSAYQHDEFFRDKFNEFCDQKVRVRQASRAPVIVESYVDSMMRYMKLWSLKSSDPSDFLSRAQASRMPELDQMIPKLVEDLHHLNRKTIFTTSSDQSVFTTFGIRANLTPTDGTLIRLVNDIICNGNEVKVTDAMDYVGVGYLKDHNGRYRPQCYPGDQVAILTDASEKFDTYKGAGGLKVLIDFSFSAKKVYMGGDSWAKKTDPRDPTDRTTAVYADYEANESQEISKDSDEWIHPVPPVFNAQWEKFKELVHDKKYDYLSVIIPIRYLLEATKISRVIMALPAPYPATMSAWVLIANSAKVKGTSISPTHVYALLTTYGRRMGLIIESYANGSAGYRRLLKMQMSFQDVICPSIVNGWLEMVKKRYTDSKSGSGLYVTDRVEHLLRSGVKDAKRLALTGAQKTSNKITDGMRTVI